MQYEIKEVPNIPNSVRLKIIIRRLLTLFQFIFLFNFILNLKIVQLARKKNTIQF